MDTEPMGFAAEIKEEAVVVSAATAVEFFLLLEAEASSN
jgi:hypothetical protein